MTLEEKLIKLKKIISKYDSCLIAFSGGVDSTFLLKAASLVLPKKKILAVTADSPLHPKEELLLAKRLARDIGIRHKVIKTDELKSKRFISNPINRCYFCKKKLFQILKAISLKFKLNYVIDASSLTDKTDFRPGEIAKKELNISSPLREAGLTKDQIRKLSKRFKLVTWDKPSLACLASRIPYGKRISVELLRRINKAEVYLKKLGFKQVRVRHYNGLCSIEVLENDIPRLLNRRNQVANKLKKFGYKYVSVDLKGYRTGSLNEAFTRKR
jgi:uncharacterized protein